MAELNTKFKQILNDIENNMQNKDDLEYVKTQIYKVYDLFFDKVNKIEKTVSSKVQTIAGTEALLQKKIEKLENKISSMEKELFVDEGESDFSITCPYCNNEFVVDYDDLKDEVECPECLNIIELDWGEENEKEGCNGNCTGCNHHIEDNEDDM